MGKRALIVVRLSRVTEATTSPERQEQACRELCEKRGYEVVGVAEDLDVSAAVPPTERPELGAWLATPDAYDVLVFYRMDRIVRRLADLADLMGWGKTHHVALVSATENYLDMDQPFGPLIALLMANVAEMELQAIRARTGSASRHTITAGRWRGGTPPWGYTPVEDGKHWRLAQDPDQVAVILDVAKRVIDGETLRSIAHDLTAQGVLTPKDQIAKRKKRKVKNSEWHSSPLKRALTSPALLGHIVTREPILDANGEPVRDAQGRRVLGPEIVVIDDAGRPVVRAKPILSREQFDRVGRALAGRENRKEPTKREAALLTQVIFCGVCDRPGYRLKGGVGRQPRYRCASAQYRSQCDNRTIPLDWADEQVEERVLSTLGRMERMRRIWFTGNDVVSELAEVREMLSDVVELVGTPGYRKGTPQRGRLDGRIAALTARQEALEATPVEESGWQYASTGETIAQWWATADPAERTLWLRQSGIRATWRSSTDAGRTTVDDLSIDMGSPDLDAEVLPGDIAQMAELRGGGAWAHDPALVGVPELLAAAWWRAGGPLSAAEE